MMRSWTLLTADEIWKLNLELDAISHLVLHHVWWYGSWRAVDDLESKRELVNLTFLQQLSLLRFYASNDELHLSSEVNGIFWFAAVTRNAFV